MRKVFHVVHQLLRMVFETGLGRLATIFWTILLSLIALILWTPVAVAHWKWGPWDSLAVLCWEMTMLTFAFYVVEPWMNKSKRNDEEKSRAWRSMFVMIVMTVLTTGIALFDWFG